MWGRDAEEIDLSIEEEQDGPAAAAAAAAASADEEAAEHDRAEERAARLHATLRPRHRSTQSLLVHATRSVVCKIAVQDMQCRQSKTS
eukprot:COSAG01_NODE_285_length_19434_cov_131.491777_15_plen_88_part_00